MIAVLDWGTRLLMIHAFPGLASASPLSSHRGSHMSELIQDRSSAPRRAGSARRLLGWVGTKNPFYVLSALLFLWGLWVSFGPQASEAEPLAVGVHTWALMSGLAGYTVLLAV